MFCLHVCTWSVSEEIPDALDTGLSMVVSYDVGADNTTQVFCNNREYSWPQSHLFIPPKFVLYKFQALILHLFLPAAPPSAPKCLVCLAKANRSWSFYTGADNSLQTLGDEGDVYALPSSQHSASLAVPM